MTGDELLSLTQNGKTKSIACHGLWWWHLPPLSMFWIPLHLKDKMNCVDDLISPKVTRVFSIVNLFYNNGYFSKYFFCPCIDFFSSLLVFFFSFETWKEKLFRLQCWLFANSVILYLWQSKKRIGNGVERGRKPKPEKSTIIDLKAKSNQTTMGGGEAKNKSQTQKQEFMPFW